MTISDVYSQSLPEFNDNNSDDNHRSDSDEAATIENHTSTDNLDESSNLPASSVSLKKV